MRIFIFCHEEFILDRRKFITSFGVGITSTAVASLIGSETLLAGQSDGLEGKIPMMQGWTTESTTQLKITRPKDKKFQYEVKDLSSRNVSFDLIDVLSFEALSEYQIDHLVIHGLSIDQVYTISVMDEHDILDQREFRALDLGRKSARIAVMSCMSDWLPMGQHEMWRSVKDSRPDLILLIGDACYIDEGSNSTPSEIWRRHHETRNKISFYRFKRLVPTLAVWDDHDFGVNNGNSSFLYKADSHRAFVSFFGSKGIGSLIHGPGLSQIVEAFGLRISLMDDRYFRSEPGIKLGTMWGSQQEDFLFNELSKSNLPTILCNGNQFYGGYLKKESYEGDYPESFKYFQQKLSNIESPVLLASGDVHFSEVMEIEKQALGYSTWELTSSSLHGESIPLWNQRKKNPRRIMTTWRNNFLLLETDTSKKDLEFKTQSLGSVMVPGLDAIRFAFQSRLSR